MLGMLSFLARAHRWMFLTLSWGITTSIRSRASCIRSRGFKLAITSEIIGKLGGRVESVPVSMSGDGSGRKHLLTRVEVPAGKQVLVGVVGKFTTTQTSNGRPDFDIGGFVSYASSDTNAHASASAVLGQSGDVNVITRSNLRTATFVGTVYTVEMEHHTKGGGMKNWDTLEPDRVKLLNKHFTPGRGGKKIDKVVIHHNAGVLSIDQIWQVWQDRQAS